METFKLTFAADTSAAYGKQTKIDIKEIHFPGKSSVAVKENISIKKHSCWFHPWL